MIDRNDVVEFFDRLAPSWDESLVRNEEIITIILDCAEISEGKDVLDVACGTGVLIPDYLGRNAGSVTGIDISPKMAAIAKEKFPQPNVTILCGDVEETEFDRLFDCIVVYNAFPHFRDGAHLITFLSGLLKPGGTLTVAHGMSRERIDAHHHGAAQHVSNGLIPAEELSAIFARTLEPVRIISDERMYLVTGRKNG